MSHHPFETWLLAEEGLTAEQAAALEAHLEDCLACRELRRGWADVEDGFRSSSSATPASGFARRWRQRWNQEQLQARHRQAGWVLSMSAGAGAAAILAILLLLASGEVSPARLASEWVKGGLLLWTQVQLVVGMVKALLGIASENATPIAGLAFAGAVGSLCALWVLSVYRYAVRGMATSGGRR